MRKLLKDFGKGVTLICASNTANIFSNKKLGGKLLQYGDPIRVQRAEVAFDALMLPNQAEVITWEPVGKTIDTADACEGFYIQFRDISAEN
jgi:hypothetical protein